jgi:hypothetical protein
MYRRIYGHPQELTDFEKEKVDGFFKYIAEKGYEPPEYMVDHRRMYMRWLSSSVYDYERTMNEMK